MPSPHHLNLPPTSGVSEDSLLPALTLRRQSQLSILAKDALLMTKSKDIDTQNDIEQLPAQPKGFKRQDDSVIDAVVSTPATMASAKPTAMSTQILARHGVGKAATDTPETSIPSSPRIPFIRHNSGSSTPRMRPTTLDIPGLTKSKVSPDGRIAKRDVGSKLIIIMVGLPARGKSYITKKLARYLNWLQHDTQIFNVGNRRRVAAYGVADKVLPDMTRPQAAAHALMNATDMPIPTLKLPESVEHIPNGDSKNEEMDQSASFFDPANKRAAEIREQVALETLDELLDYILTGDGVVGILDATNSTLARRKLIMEHIRTRDKQINVLFVESECQDATLLETNMRLKLSGPDYKDKDPVASFEDFKKRVTMYEKYYVPLGEYEEKNNMSYVKMIDVGKKVISYAIRGFLSSQAVYYLLNFNLAPRQIWITRHGESMDNVRGRIGGDSELSENGKKYGKVLAKFVAHNAEQWEIHQQDKLQNIHQPPAAGDHTPPNPYVSADGQERNFCVWTSMLRRSIQTSEYFNDDDFEVKQMRMLNELYSGSLEGMTYEEIQDNHADEYKLRQADKLAYRYPGPGGEGYLDVINRLRPVIVELERMTDHCLLICHRSVARVLLAYFMGLKRDDVANLDAPLGMLYCLEPVSSISMSFSEIKY
jgi:6-phosphofructo-2-kinase